MKYIIFSFDDGVTFDKDVISILNKYDMGASFNLNSGLDNFTWYLDTLPIQRLVLRENTKLYEGHEICSHTLSHPYLTSCSDDALNTELYQDKINLESIFNRIIEGFVVPFDQFDERIISYVKKYFSYCRLPIKSDSTIHPEDQYHIAPNVLTFEGDIYNSISNFINKNVDNEYLIVAGHTYDFVSLGLLCEFEEALKLIKNTSSVRVITMGEYVKMRYKG